MRRDLRRDGELECLSIATYSSGISNLAVFVQVEVKSMDGESDPSIRSS